MRCTPGASPTRRTCGSAAIRRKRALVLVLRWPLAGDVRRRCRDRLAVQLEGRAAQQSAARMRRPDAPKSRCVAFHPKSLVVAQGYEDGLLLLCRIPDGAEILVRAAPDGGRAITALAGTIRVAGCCLARLTARRVSSTCPLETVMLRRGRKPGRQAGLRRDQGYRPGPVVLLTLGLSRRNAAYSPNPA